MPLHDALDLKAAEVEAMTDSFEEVKDTQLQSSKI